MWLLARGCFGDSGWVGSGACLCFHDFDHGFEEVHVLVCEVDGRHGGWVESSWYGLDRGWSENGMFDEDGK